MIEINLTNELGIKLIMMDKNQHDIITASTKEKYKGIIGKNTSPYYEEYLEDNSSLLVNHATSASKQHWFAFL